MADIKMLTEMGFSTEMAREAMTAAGGNVELALELLTSDHQAKPAAKPVPKQTPKPPPKPTPVKPAPVVMTPIVSVVPVEDDAPPLSANGKKMLSASDEGFLMEEDIGIVHRVYQAESSCNTTKVMDPIQIAEEVAAELERIAGICSVSLTQAGALLKFFRYDAEKLMERYFEDPDRVKKQAGIVGNASSQSFAPKSKECLVCFDDISPKNGSSLPCGHSFCNDCWAKHLSVQINEGQSLGITCMAAKCKCVVPEEIVRINTRPELYRKYRQFIAKNFVDDNPNIKWCPAKGCNNAVRSEIRSALSVRCSCGFKFCFVCTSEAHTPANCDSMSKWVKKCQDDSETFNWLKTNTQECPKCKTSIEKNGGCNHMTCRKCKHEFCWICNANWSGHGACNKFPGSGEKKEQSDSRAALERYLHYYHRYITHEKSKSFEVPMREKAVQKMMKLRDANPERAVDLSYIERAVEQLIECRRTLKYTYVFAYYLPDGSAEKNLFEYLQADLEVSTEKLSGLLEAEANPDDVNEKKRLLDATSVAGKRLKHLIEGVEEGLTSVPPAIPVRELLKGGGGTPTTNKQQQQQQLPAKSPVVDKKDKKEREKEKEREKKEKEAKKIAKK